MAPRRKYDNKSERQRTYRQRNRDLNLERDRERKRKKSEQLSIGQKKVLRQSNALAARKYRQKKITQVAAQAHSNSTVWNVPGTTTGPYGSRQSMGKAVKRCASPAAGHFQKESKLKNFI